MSERMRRTSWDEDSLVFIGLLKWGGIFVFTVIYLLTAPEPLPAIELDREAPLTILFRLLIRLISYPPILFLLSFTFVRRHVLGILDQFCQRMYDLPEEETLSYWNNRRKLGMEDGSERGRTLPIRPQTFIERVLFGLWTIPPPKPILPVREGRVLPSGPPLMRRFGGPGFLSVAHDNAVVIAHHGVLTKVLGPDFHKLRPFEKVWDVVDLRPQRRAIVVTANTRDGIPVTCEAEIRFHLDNGEKEAHHALQFTEYSKRAVLQVTTQKVALAPEKEQRFTDWRKRMASGVLDGKIRDWIERWRLDELLAPDLEGPPTLERMQKEVEAEVRETGLKLGVFVENVDIKSLEPDTEDISKQWLDLWKTEWDQVRHKREAEAKAAGTEIVRKARLQAKAELIVDVLQNIESLEPQEQVYLRDSHYLDSLIFVRFIEIVRKMAESDPLVRSTMFGEGKDFLKLLESLRESPLYSLLESKRGNLEVTKDLAIDAEGSDTEASGDT